MHFKNIIVCNSVSIVCTNCVCVNTKNLFSRFHQSQESMSCEMILESEAIWFIVSYSECLLPLKKTYESSLSVGWATVLSFF